MVPFVSWLGPSCLGTKLRHRTCECYLRNYFLKKLMHNFCKHFLSATSHQNAWCIWNERNDFIFNGKAPSLASWKSSSSLKF